MMPVSIQIQRTQTEKWRYLGFVSAVVGLLCYALSSSFNHLFGHWNLFKFFLYSIFSFIIIFITLFAKVWQCSTSTVFKTRMAVLVLLATTFYSFFYDKAVNQKPDAYILLSCVAFAVMSLSLSKQIHFGCEGDLLNYFLGCIILLLMKINLWLFFVGAGFSYSLSIFHSSLDALSDSGISELQDLIDIRVDSQDVNTNSSSQADSQHVNTNGAIQVDSQHVHTNGMPVLIQFEACISALEKEEEAIFSRLCSYLLDEVDIYSNNEVGHHDNLLIDLLPAETINSLEETVKLMVAAGFEKECYNMYISCRREFLQKCFLGLQLLELNREKNIPLAITTWMEGSYIALRILFPCERRLCNHIFGTFSSADLSFMEVCREFTIGLLNFLNNVAIKRCSWFYLKNCLDAFHLLGDFIPELESLFYGDASLINEGIAVWERLGEAIRVDLVELEHDICRDIEQQQQPVPNGGIDPITNSVVEKLFFKQRPMAGDREGTSSVSVHMARTVELLDRNLEAKSQNYTDPALSYVFMMNNCKLIANIVDDGEKATILVDDWIKKLTTKFQQNLEDYHRTWDKVLDILKLGSNESEESMKEKLKLFNLQFKEICRVQSGWVVLDEHLREQIKKSIEILLLPAYGNFIWRFQSLLGNQAYEYIKYGIYHIEVLLNDLLGGTGSKRPKIKGE